MLNALHKQLLNDYQHGFPLSPTPYKDVADALGVEEEEVLTALRELSDHKFISRIGPIVPPNRIGVSTLAAMTVPEDRLEKIAGIISRFPEVNHNYEREHRFNLWFVVIASDDNHLQNVITKIERQCGHKAMQLPLLDDYFINLGFEMELDD